MSPVSDTSAGVIDTSFGAAATGIVTTVAGATFDQSMGVAIQSDGKIVAAGYCTVGGSHDFCLARYDGDPVDTNLASIIDARPNLTNGQ